MILSQLPTRMMPSKAWAFDKISTLSAMTSREGREYFMPLWPIAMPSHTPMQGTITGLPPAAMTPSAAARATWSRYICPGMMSLCAEMMPTMGFFISLSVQPRARRSERCDAILLPFVKVFMILPLFVLQSFLRKNFQNVPPRAKPRFCFSILSASKTTLLLLNTFREQNHAFALRDSICPILRA